MTRLAYLCNRYPAVSNTFILQEIAALRRLGAQIDTISVRRPNVGDLLAEADRSEHAETHYLLPPSPGRLVLSHLRALLTRPRRYLRTLALAWRLSAPGIRAHVWQLLYFAEAVLVWDFCRRRGLSHLHAHFAYVACDDALLAAALGGWTWSFSMHGPPEFYDVRGTRLAQKVEHADAVVCISDFCRSQLMTLVEERHWGKLRVVRCGIRTDLYSPRAATPPPPPNGTANVLMVARLAPVKGHAVLLDAVAELAGRGLDISLTLIGDGPLRGSLQDRAETLGLTRQVRFLGSVGQDDIRAEYERSHIFCLPSFAEGLPVVLMEAMAMQLPVVASRIMGVPELVEDGITGLLVTPGRFDEVAAALDRLIADPSLRTELGQAGRAKVLAAHDVDRNAIALRGVLDGAAVAA